MSTDAALTPTQRQAAHLLRRGWSLVPVPHRTKEPKLSEWQKLRLTERDITTYFDGQAQNIGALQGAPSDGRVDADLDAPQAVHLAPGFLPSTACIFGRAGKRSSHWEYCVR